MNFTGNEFFITFKSFNRYVRLVDAIFQGINQLSLEHPKTPSQVVKMENYHHMHSQLARLKVVALENMKKEAKQRYNEALRSYVTKYFGRPLEKLNVRPFVAHTTAIPLINSLISFSYSSKAFK